MMTFKEYVLSVLDVNKDGVVTVKDFVAMFPNYAVTIAFIFVDLLVLAAEYRVWDVGYTITGGSAIKAIGFVLVSAVPFLLGQVMWLYPRATWLQKVISIGLMAGGLYTSAAFGMADLSQKYDVEALVMIVVYLTAAYVVAILTYIITDPAIRAHRLKAKIQAQAELEQEIQRIGRSILEDLRKTQALQNELAHEFGADVVDEQLTRLRGSRNAKANTKQATLPGDGDDFFAGGPKPARPLPTQRN